MVENCYICKTNLETTEHLFYECQTVHNLCKSLHDFISSGSRNIDFWSFQNIQIGVILKDKKRSSWRIISLLLQNIIYTSVGMPNAKCKKNKKTKTNKQTKKT